MSTIMNHSTAPHMSPEAQEWLGRIRETEARNYAQHAAKEISDEEFWATGRAVDKAYREWEAHLPAPADCPPWCNAHWYNAQLSDNPEGNSIHVHEVKVGEAMLSIAEDDTAPGGLAVDIYGACNMSLEQVGEFGAALMAAHGRIEGGEVR